MADRKTANRQHQSANDKLQKARNDFILAMEQLAHEGVPNNPYSALVKEVFPGWWTAGSPARAPLANTSGRFQYHRNRQNLVYGPSARQALRRRIIEDWARSVWLVNMDHEPADWIVGHVEELFQSAERAASGAGPPPLRQLSSTSGQSKLPEPFIPELRIPMADPSLREGEQFDDFMERARVAFKVRLRQLKRMPTSGSSATPTLPEDAPHTGPGKLQHYLWLVLYQCCRWKLEQVHAYAENAGYIVGNLKEHDSAAIWMGLKRKADLLQISLRPSA